jgi:amino acid permease
MGELDPLLGKAKTAARGSFSSSIFMLANSACGSGVLAFPYAFTQAGDVLALVLCGLFAAVMGSTLHTLVEAADKTSGSTYQQLVGRRIGRSVCIVVEILIIVYEFFACVGFFIIIPNAIEPLLKDTGSFATYYEPTRRAIVGLVAGIVVLPLMCCREINSLRHTSTIAIFSILYLVVLVSYNGVLKLTTKEGVPAAESSLVGAPTDPWRAVPLICLALQCHIQIPAIYAEVAPSLKSVAMMDRVIVAAVTICLALYIPTGFLGHAAFGVATPPDVLSANFQGPIAAVNVARLCLIITAASAIPLNHYPARSALHSLCFAVCKSSADQVGSINAPRGARAEENGSAVGHQRPEQMSASFAYTEAAIFYVLALACAVFVPDLSVCFDVMGACAGVAVIFFVPACLCWQEGQRWRASVLICIGAAVAAASLLDIASA